jgi:hypothetical protein
MFSLSHLKFEMIRLDEINDYDIVKKAFQITKRL